MNDSRTAPRVSVLQIAVALVIAGLACKQETTPAPAPSPPKASEPEEAAKPEKPDWEVMIDAWTEGDPIPDVELVSQEGKMFRLSTFDDSYWVVGFIFTRCPVPTACPLTMQKMKQVQDAWKEAQKAGRTGAKKLRLLTVSFDPGFDKPPVLTIYGKGYGADFAMWTIATGEAGLVSDGLPALFSVIALPDSRGSIRHNVKVALVGPERMPIEEWSDNSFEPKGVVDMVIKHDADADADADAD